MCHGYTNRRWRGEFFAAGESRKVPRPDRFLINSVRLFNWLSDTTVKSAWKSPLYRIRAKTLGTFLRPKYFRRTWNKYVLHLIARPIGNNTSVVHVKAFLKNFKRYKKINYTLLKIYVLKIYGKQSCSHAFVIKRSRCNLFQHKRRQYVIINTTTVIISDWSLAIHCRSVLCLG